MVAVITICEEDKVWLRATSCESDNFLHCVNDLTTVPVVVVKL